MIKSILGTPSKVLADYIRTILRLPSEFARWREMVARQAPVVYDEEHFRRTGSCLDKFHLYPLPIAYKLLFFRMIGGGNGRVETYDPTLEPSRQPREKSALQLFFEGFKVSEWIGTVFEFRVADGYIHVTTRWLGLIGRKPPTFQLYQVVGVGIEDIPSALDAAGIGIITMTVQLGVDRYITLRIPVNGEGSRWRDQFTEFQGVEAIEAMLNEAVAAAKDEHAEAFSAFQRRSMGLGGGPYWTGGGSR